MKNSLVPLQHYLYMYPIIFTSYNLSISGKNLTKYHNIKLWKGGGVPITPPSPLYQYVHMVFSQNICTPNYLMYLHLFCKETLSYGFG